MTADLDSHIDPQGVGLILPCPFCGKTPDATDARSFNLESGGKWGAVQCCIIGPEVRTRYEPLESWRDEAIAAWNTRAPKQVSAGLDAAHSATIRSALSIAIRHAEIEREDGSKHAAELVIQFEAAKAALAQLDATPAATPLGEWERVIGDVAGLDRTSISIDDLAITIGYDDTALATFVWPDEGQWGLFRRTNAHSDD